MKVKEEKMDDKDETKTEVNGDGVGQELEVKVKEEKVDGDKEEGSKEDADKKEEKSEDKKKGLLFI